jgi:hypothetical protein
MDKSSDSVHIETHSAQYEIKPQVMGNVKLLQGNETVLVPTPSPDPNGKSKIHPDRRERARTLASSQTPNEQLSHTSSYEHSSRTIENVPLLSISYTESPSADIRSQADKALQIL